VGELIDLLDEALHEVVTDTTPKPDPTQQAFEAFDLYRRLGVMAS